MINDQELQKLRDVRIFQILGKEDVGRKVCIKCPVHNDRTASFFVYPDNSFHCFGCNINGQGAIDFLEALGYEFKSVIEELKKYA